MFVRPCLRFMFGTKHAGQDSKTEFDPAMAKFNLVVPSRNCLDNFFPQYVMIKEEMKPGINKGILKLIAGRKSNVYHVITFDGKKIVPN